jgi:hypothetical protein
MPIQATRFSRNEREPHGTPGNFTSALPAHSPGSGVRMQQEAKAVSELSRLPRLFWARLGKGDAR